MIRYNELIKDHFTSGVMFITMFAPRDQEFNELSVGVIRASEKALDLAHELGVLEFNGRAFRLSNLGEDLQDFVQTDPRYSPIGRSFNHAHKAYA